MLQHIYRSSEHGSNWSLVILVDIAQNKSGTGDIRKQGLISGGRGGLLSECAFMRVIYRQDMTYHFKM